MFLGGMLVVSSSAGAAGQSVSFRWLPNSEPDVAGYKIHYGVASRTYTQVLDVGDTTSATISNLAFGTTYYFALTAYNTIGWESAYTRELVHSVPMMLAPLQIRMAPPRQTVLTVTGPAGRTYDIQASEDLQNWTKIGSVTIGANGSSVFTENNPPSRLKRFYRAFALQP
jgi:hypothetical protein